MSLPADTAQLADVACRLHLVREAYRDFVTQWAVEQMAQDADAMRRLAEDVSRALQEEPDAEGGWVGQNPYGPGWSGLYRGADLDD